MLFLATGFGVRVLRFEDGAIRDEMRLQIDILYGVGRHIEWHGLLAPFVVPFLVQAEVPRVRIKQCQVFVLAFVLGQFVHVYVV